ncbi:MAG: DUF2339 domain-containing protein [Verrucomicrobia bacterium]|nr:DUF2339 domain-containing protein [Verrucomicrobiota bacterium]
MEAPLIVLGVLLSLLVIAAPFVAIISAVITHQRLKALEEQMAAQRREVERLQTRLGEAAPPVAERASVPSAPARPASQVKPVAVPPLVTPEPRKPPPQPVAERASVPATAGSLAASATRTAPPPLPPQPPPPPVKPPAPAKPPFDWEALLGVRGAAWVGAIAFVIAGTLFLKYSFDNNLITPTMQVAMIILSGVGMLVGTEFVLRKGYAVTANALCGAGVAVLYAGFFAAHGVYHLIPMFPTFALMALVTVVACLLAVRYDSLFIAVLGLLGGFATPLVLSTGQDRPIGLFSYILLLDVGLLWIATRKGWNVIVLLSLAATFLIEVLWFNEFMTPEKMLLGVGIFTVFGLLYLLLPGAAKAADRKMMLRAALLGGIAPFLFAFYLAGNRQYAVEWTTLFGFIACLDVALVAVALARREAMLAISGALATAFTLVLWATQALSADNLWGASLSAVALCAVFNLAPRIGRRIALQTSAEEWTLMEASGLIAAGGLGLYALALSGRGFGEPPWVFLCLLVALIAMVTERCGRNGLDYVMPIGAAAVAVIVQFWFFNATTGETLLRNLSFPVLVAVSWAGISVLRHGRPESLPPAQSAHYGIGVVAGALVAVAGLFFCLANPELGRDPWPLQIAMALLAVLLVAVALYRDWSWLTLVVTGAAAALGTLWHANYFHDNDWSLVLPIYVAFYLAFLALPFVMPRSLAPSWQTQPWPWLASALAGPLYFLALYKAFVAGCGKSFIAVLPVAMAGLSVAGLAHVLKRFPVNADAEASRQRLRLVALFAAVALGFVSVAIPLQLDRQWITIGWALEAAAVWWLYQRVPHVGLKYFGLALFLTVGARLLMNPEVLRYEERGWPIFNWILYTYGVAALCCLGGAALLKPVEVPRLNPAEREFFGNGKWGLAPVVGFLGLLIVFALINLEIADYFSTGRYLEISWERRYDRDLTTSVAWGVYALALLIIGLWRRTKPLRFISLGFMVLTIGKVFLYDLSSLTGLHRVLSFLGLAVALVAVSVLYQRFVFRKEPPS